MKPRKGFSLIELLTAIAVGSALMAVVVGMLHLVLRAEQTCRQRRNDHAMVANLTTQFRRDVHAAQRFSSNPWQFEMAPDHLVRYRREPDVLIRSETVAGQLRSHEQYPLPASIRVAISAEGERPRMITLQIAPEPGKSTEPACKEVKIDASLGMDHRFATAVAGGGKSP